MPLKMSSDIALKKAIEAHNDKYEYPDWDYKGTGKSIKIFCKEHGVFEQLYANHVYKKKGCPDCYGNRKMTTETFIVKAILVHGDRYDYSKVVYINNSTKVCIICKEHGEFWQIPADHLQGSGCNNCALANRSLTRDHDWFLQEANKKHNNFYEYPEEYKGIKTKIMIRCPKHGLFPQTPDKHLHEGNGCPHCANQVSKPEIEIIDFIKDAGYECVGSCRKTIHPKELDILIPSLNKAIEYNGWYWHYGDKFFKPGKHAEKSNLCRAQGIKLLHIREDLWLKDKDKMKEVILKFINKN